MTLHLHLLYIHFNFTTFERQILYFSLHYISIKVLEVESHYSVAASVGDYNVVKLYSYSCVAGF